MTELLRQISELLTTSGIHNFPKEEKTCRVGIYFGIYKHEKCLYFTHYHHDNFMEAITPRRLSPDDIEARYDIRGEGDPEDYVSYRSKTHYVLKLPLTNGLLNGRFTIPEKRDFFVEIAKMR
jgi:hypothetical protein